MDRDNTIARLENIAKHAVHTAGEDIFILNLDDGIAIHEAIEALKAQLFHESTTSDLISRQAVINAIENTNAKMSMPEWDEITNAVMSLPTAQPEPQWIPVSERLPEESGWYICTCHDGVSERVTFLKWQKRLKQWEKTGTRSYWKVIAWMPLPKPFEGGTK